MPRYHVDRLGNIYLSQWRCRFCRQRIMLVRHRAPQENVPIYFHLVGEECQQHADMLPTPTGWMPPRGPSEAAVRGGAKPREPSPRYPWPVIVKPGSLSMRSPMSPAKKRSSSVPTRGSHANRLPGALGQPVQCVDSVCTTPPPGGTTLLSLALTLSEAALSPVRGRT